MIKNLSHEEKKNLINLLRKDLKNAKKDIYMLAKANVRHIIKEARVEGAKACMDCKSKHLDNVITRIIKKQM